jgi:hypothetical protein
MTPLAIILAVLVITFISTLYWLNKEEKWWHEDREIRELYSDKHK